MDSDRDSTDAWGIQHRWLDADDVPHGVPEKTVARLREVIGEAPDDLEQRAPIVTRPGRELDSGPARVTCEDGSERRIDGRVPDDMPLGYHRLHGDDGTERLLVVSPGRCWLPSRRTWGWAVQLYGARSAASWGIGDLGDLRTLREWTERTGGGFLLVNPLHAVAPVVPLEPSPYLPATRRFRNPVYLRVQEVPGWSPDDADPEAVRRVNASELIDRDATWELKRAVLRKAYDRFGSAGGDRAFDTWREQRGAGLEEFATWCALVEEHGPDWHGWPAALRRPDGGDVAAFARTHEARVGFHAWLQWQLDVQLRSATGDLTVLQDLPIGVSGGGADAWAWQEGVAQGVTVGAPPDALNTLGQDWGSPPMVPWRLRLAEYEPFIESVRGTISGAGGLRIDHVMGLFRLWWIPEGAGATEGAYVRYPSDDLLDIVALESHRAQAVVVGEDLGTVEPDVPEALSSRAILSYKVLWFEEDDPAEWPVEALATVTTHDLPTVAGLWTGSDAEDQLATTGMPEEDVRQGRADLLAKLSRSALTEDAPTKDALTEDALTKDAPTEDALTEDALPGDATPEEAVETAYRELSRAPSLLLSLSLEDAVLEERRPNVPGTVERHNWRLPLPVPVEALADVPSAARLVQRVTEALADEA